MIRHEGLQLCFGSLHWWIVPAVPGLYPHFSVIIYSIFQVYPPICISCIKKKYIVNLMREIHLYCGKLQWTLIMTLL